MSGVQQLLCVSELTKQRGLGAAQLAETYRFCCSLWLRGRHEKGDYWACLVRLAACLHVSTQMVVQSVAHLWLIMNIVGHRLGYIKASKAQMGVYKGAWLVQACECDDMKHGHVMHAKGLHMSPALCSMLVAMLWGMFALGGSWCAYTINRHLQGTVSEVQAGILCDIRSILSWRLIERHLLEI